MSSQQTIKAASLSIDGFCKSGKNNEFYSNQGYKQMTWVQEPIKVSDFNKGNDSTFYTSVNSISTIDPVTQAYIDNLFFSELPKKLSCLMDMLTKLRNEFDTHMKEHSKTYNEIFSKLNDVSNRINECNDNNKYQQITDQIKNELSSYIKSNDEKVTKLKKSILTLNDKHSNLAETISKNQTTKQFQEQISSITTSTLNCINRLEDKINDNKVLIDSLENKLKITEKAYQNIYNSFESNCNEKITELHNSSQQKIEDLNKNINILQERIKKNEDNMNNLNKKNPSSIDISQLKNYITKDEFKEHISNDSNQQNDILLKSTHLIKNVESSLIQKISNFECEISHLQEQFKDQKQHHISTSNSNSKEILDKFNLLERNVTDSNLNISQQLLKLKTEINSLTNQFNNENHVNTNRYNVIQVDIDVLKHKISILENKLLSNSYHRIPESIIDIPGESNAKTFYLTIGEPESITYEKLTPRHKYKLHLTKAYQDYVINSHHMINFDNFYPNEEHTLREAKSASQIPTIQSFTIISNNSESNHEISPEHNLKEPSGPKSARRLKNFKKKKALKTQK